MKILFAGSPGSAAQILQNLYSQDCEIVGVISQPDRRSKRGGAREPSAVSAEALKLGIPLFTPALIDDEFYKIISSVECDFLVVSAYGKILPDWLLAHPKVAPINIHFSLLPKYRGASPIQACLLNGDQETGISIMQMSSGLDEGPIYSKHSFEIPALCNRNDLEQHLTNLCNRKLFKTLLNILNFKKNALEQDHDSASYCSKISKASGEIIFLEERADVIFQKFQALSGWPGLFFRKNGLDIKIHGMSLQPVKIDPDISGNFIFFENKLIVRTIDSMIVITHLQFPGKKTIMAADAANSYSDFFKD